MLFPRLSPPRRAARFRAAPSRRSAYRPSGLLASRRFGSLQKSRGQNGRYVAVAALAPVLSAFLLLAAAHAPARAVFIAAEMDAVDTEPLFDSEYFLDLLGFAPPLDWRYDWLASSGGYLANGASLDRSDLLWEQTLRFSRELGERFRFRYDLRQRGDKDLAELHQWLALEARTWRGLTLGVFGEPGFAKEDADMGLLARWEAGAWSFAASRDSVDFNFNERGRTTQSYPRKPYTYEFAASRRSGPDTVSAACELDAPLERAVPSSNRLYAYRRTRAALRWDRVPAPGGRGWSAGYSLDLKRESDAFSPDPSARSLSERRSVHELSWGGTAPLSARDSIEAGGRFLTRSAQVETPNAPLESSEHRRWELAPYARWRRTLRPWAVSELAAFLSYGEIRRRFPADPSRGSAQKPWRPSWARASTCSRDARDASVFTRISTSTTWTAISGTAATSARCSSSSKVLIDP